MGTNYPAIGTLGYDDHIKIQSYRGDWIEAIAVGRPCYLYRKGIREIPTTALRVDEASGAELKYGPHNAYKTILNIPYNSFVEIIRKKNNFLFVQYNGHSGWIKDPQYIDPLELKVDEFNRIKDGDLTRKSEGDFFPVPEVDPHKVKSVQREWKSPDDVNIVEVFIMDEPEIDYQSYPAWTVICNLSFGMMSILSEQDESSDSYQRFYKNYGTRLSLRYSFGDKKNVRIFAGIGMSYSPRHDYIRDEKLYDFYEKLNIHDFLAGLEFDILEALTVTLGGGTSIVTNELSYRKKNGYHPTRLLNKSFNAPLVVFELSYGLRNARLIGGVKYNSWDSPDTKIIHLSDGQYTIGENDVKRILLKEYIGLQLRF